MEVGPSLRSQDQSTRPMPAMRVLLPAFIKDSVRVARGSVKQVKSSVQRLIDAGFNVRDSQDLLQSFS